MNALLVLSAADVERALTPRLCIEAVEDAFGLLARGSAPAPGILGLVAAAIAAYRSYTLTARRAA